MGIREDVRRLLSRGSVVLVVGAVALLLLLWTSATPRPPFRIEVAGPAQSVAACNEGVDAADRAAACDDNDIRLKSEFNRAPYRGPQGASTPFSEIIGWGSVALVAAGVLAVLALVGRALLRAWRERRVTEADAAVVDLERVAAAVVTDREERLAALATGSAAEGIIAAWTRLERTLEGAGVALPASRTSSETAVDVLRRFAVDERALTELGALYREASWSRHPLTEADRERAEAALRTLDADLARATGATGASARG